MTTSGRTRYLRRGGNGKVGRIQRQILRLSYSRDLMTTADLAERCYPRLKPDQLRPWHWWNIRRAAERFLVRAGRTGRHLLWRPKSPP